MGFSMNVEQLIHEAVDAKNGQINQYFLVKLLEVIVRQSNIQTLNVDFTENDKEQSCELSKSFEQQSMNKEPSEETILNSHVASTVSGISTTDIQDNSTLTCSSVDSFEESLESIYKPPPAPEEIISELELIEEEVDKISTPSTLSLNQFLEKKHEYFLHNNDQRVIAELIEKLFAKIKKVDDATKHLMKSIKTINLEDSESSPDSEIDAFKKIAISDMGSPFEVEKYGYDPFKLDENLKNLEISAKGEAFREIFGATQKIKDLHSNLSILNFREFDLEYRTNFRTIQTFIELHKELLHKANSNIKELQKNCLNNDYRKFKKDALLRLTKIEDDITKYIARDPEAMGIARFINDGACMSCATPARMKITNTAPISVGKDAHTKSGSRLNRETLQEQRRKTNTNKPTCQIRVSPINIKTEQTKNSLDVGNCNYKLNKLQMYFNRSPHYKTSSYNRVLKDIQKMHEYDCRQRELTVACTKDALEIRLTQHFADMGLQANAIRFQSMETNRSTRSDSDTSQVCHTGPPATAVVNQTPAQHPLDTPNPPPTPTHQQATDMIQTAHGILKEVRESAESSPHRHSLESRLTMLEDCMARFGDDQRRIALIAETMRRLEMGMARQAPEHQPGGT